MFCHRPYEQLYVDVEGDAHLCCPEWIAMPAGNVLATDPLAIWNGNVARNIRKSVADQSFRHCINCPFLPGPAGCVTAEPPLDLPVDSIRTLTIAYDPTCNLTCPQCRRTHKRATPRTRAIHEALLRSDVFSRVRHLKASGSGDPLASPMFWETLARLPADRYPDLLLKLQTNGLLLDEAAWLQLGPYADRVAEVSVSVDAATPETYLANRGGDWCRLMRNLTGVQRRGVPLQLNFVVQANNFREMPDFTRMGDALGAKLCYFSALDWWGDTYDKTDYLRRAVHLPMHPEHQQLLAVLRDPSLGDPRRTTLARLPRP